VDLHAAAAVAALLETHWSTLARYHGYLDAAVPKVCAMWEPLYPDISQLPGDVFCGDVRAVVWRIAALSRNRPRSLAVAPLPPNSKQLVDSFGTAIRIRRHPWDYKRGQRVAVEHTTVDAQPLFGDAPSLSFGFAILWEPNLRTGILHSAFLAAVHGLDTGNPAIYAREPLPEPIFDTTVEGGFGGGYPSDDDFGPSEGLGDEPA
jgi:hypothetical protein